MTKHQIRHFSASAALLALALVATRSGAQIGRFGKGPGTQAAFTADTRNRDSGLIYQANQSTAPGAAESAKMDFSHADAADAAQLNSILWRDRKGDVPMPAPVYRWFGR